MNADQLLRAKSEANQLRSLLDDERKRSAAVLEMRVADAMRTARRRGWLVPVCLMGACGGSLALGAPGVVAALLSAGAAGAALAVLVMAWGGADWPVGG